MTLRILLAAIAVCTALRAVDAPPATAGITRITIGDTVLRSACKRFGINVGGDSSWNPVLTERCRINFEGTAYRRCVNVAFPSSNTTMTTFMLSPSWVGILTNHGHARFTVLSGAGHGVSGRIVAVRTADKVSRWAGNPTKLEQLYALTLDRPVHGVVKNDGVLVEALHTNEGQIAYGQQAYYTNKDKARLTIVHDVPPASFGVSALRLDNADYILRCGTVPAGATTAGVTGTVWAKAATPGATLAVLHAKMEIARFALTSAWKRYSCAASATAENAGEVWLTLRAAGAVLLDDIAVDMDGDTNPTPFRDAFVKIMQDFRPGIIRTLQMGGGDVPNFLRPTLARYTYTHRLSTQPGPHATHDYQDFTPHQYYALCAQLDAEPWLNLPGTITADQLSGYMEFLGAPADVGQGQRRAQLGHAAPFTKSLKAIHVEFGNEIWNFADPYYGCGYNGPDFWQGLIAAGKASPWYASNIIFHVGGRAFPEMQPPPDYVPNADRFTWAPYILHGLSKTNEQQLGSDENLLRWAFARAINNACGKGEMASAVTQAKGIAPVSIYEISHHLMMFDKDDPRQGSIRARNVIQGSLAGALNVANAMLMHLKYNGAIDQCYFSYGAQSYPKGFNLDRDMYSAWSTHVVMPDGRIVYQPCFLALATVNKALGGSLLETVHAGAQPTFTGFEMQRLTPVPGLSTLWSYAFADGTKRSLIVVNLDLECAQEISVAFAGTPAPNSARAYRVTGASFTANNLAGQGVRVVQNDLPAFANGARHSVPAASLLVLTWNQQ